MSDQRALDPAAVDEYDLAFPRGTGVLGQAEQTLEEDALAPRRHGDPLLGVTRAPHGGGALPRGRDALSRDGWPVETLLTVHDQTEGHLRKGQAERLEESQRGP